MYGQEKEQGKMHPVIETREEMFLREAGRTEEEGRKGVNEKKKKKRCD